MTARLALVFACLLAGAAQAQERPPFPPQSPFRAEARFPGGATGEIRYQDGKARVDAVTPNGPSTAYLDIAARTAVLVISLHGMNMAMEVALDEFGVPQASDVPAERIGSATVLDEACALWRFRDPKSGRSGTACLTPDGIPLLADGGSGGGEGMVVTALERGLQDAAALAPPAGLPTMKASGLGNLPFDLPIPGLGR